MGRNSAGGALVALICLAVFAAVFIIYTMHYLPNTVATHFGVDNRANGWMSRHGYVLFMLGFLVGVPSFVSFVVGVLPRRYPQWTNLPNRDYWLSTARREDSLSFLAAHGMRLACLIVMLMLGMHYTVLLANRTQPPALPLPMFSSIFISFALALLWWIVRLYRRFPKPR